MEESSVSGSGDIEVGPVSDGTDGRPRQPGSMAGQFEMSDDFDDPLPDWLLDLFEGVEPPSTE